ncbi:MULTISPECIES: ABC transporter permease [Oceanibaculum]|uniref:Binding-protein-dependent transport systems inner membrane component n=2 Tax=Oceanibaculum indicum TaxID=526216 RepID=K2K105_9PROT|nr:MULTISPECIES: ABC transporter permease [Oceanibaculum]EKE76494.1 binding-protein-dependent transport systems inner membrane component [Oceanibaculum indicum P24]MCH2393916.1 ABC transporter permease [Oceanibaculum sp.]RKQ70479.1 peptide/nickel transport system permease protein/oligopeptide transport system permease protein [Oceanibaculum indicum]
MSRHIAHRLLISIPVLFGVLLIGFLLLQVVPTDPATVLAGPTATAADVAALREAMGLNEPLWYQFGLYIFRVLQLDLGRSIISNSTVVSELANTVGPTVELMIASLIWAVPLGILLGTIAAVRRGRVTDRIVMAFSVAGVSMPIFWFGLMLIQYVGFKMELLPFQGRGGPLWSIDGLRHIALPAITLGGVFIGPVARMTRTSLLEVLNADFVRTARAKGAPETRVVVKHALRNALIPIVTLVGLQIGFLLGGAVVTETMFAWPGVGRLAVGAIVSSDFPLAQGAILLLAVSFLLVNLIVDVLYAYLDPRVGRK